MNGDSPQQDWNLFRYISTERLSVRRQNVYMTYRPLHISMNTVEKKVVCGCFSVTHGHSWGTRDQLDNL